MASKNLITINLGGGMDGMNAVAYRDARSVGFLSTARQSAPANILNYVEAPSVVTNLTKDQNTFTHTGTVTAVVGDLCYGEGLPRSRKLTVSGIATDGGTGITTITISAPSWETVANATVYFGAATELFKLNEVPALAFGGSPVNPAFHQNLRWLADAFNVKPIVANASKTKAAVVSLIGPMIVKYYKLNSSNGIFNMQTDNGSGGRRAILGSETVKSLTSHNDQTSTWLANAPEGAVEGWGGGIADTFLASLPTDAIKGMAAVTLEAGTPFTSGSQAVSYNASANSVLLQYPGFATNAWPHGKEGAGVMAALDQIIRDAAKLDPNTYDNDFHQSVGRFNESAELYQPLLKNAPEITSPPTAIAAAIPLLGNLKQILRLMQMNNPNRGFTFTRAGNTVTAATQISNGTATRTAGSTSTKIVCAGHGLFTSGASTTNLTDSVVITGIDASTPVNGYKITLTPGDEDNSFTVVTTANTALTDAPVTLRLKHNFVVENKVFVKDTTHPIDSVIPVDGFQILTVPDFHTITFATTSSGAYAGANTGFAKLIHLDKQVFYTNTPGFSWDTHNESNALPLNNLDAALTYFDSIASRMVNANYVGFTITEFGRTFSTNATGGTDHGWGNSAFVWGKDVIGNKVYGDSIDYDPNGAHIGSNMLIPTTSVYQYGATLAKWMGSTDAEILELFPKLVNWPVNERYLGFL